MKFLIREKRATRQAAGRRRALVASTLFISEPLEARRMFAANVLTWHNDAARTGLNSSEAILTTANVNTSTFGQLFSYAVSGQVYAQPLYVSNLAIPGKGTHNVVFIATETNDIYAFDGTSNSGATAGLLWHVNLGLAAATPNAFFGNRYGGAYSDLTPWVGVTSTPVIDLANNTIFIDAFTNDGAGLYSHHIHALDITTGADKVTPKLVAGAVAGNGVGNDTFDAKQEIQRVALSLVNGTIYAAFAGYADSDPYHGWILGFSASSANLLALTSIFNDTPNLLVTPATSHADEGGFWNSGAGFATDGTNLFAISGNGDFDVSKGDYGDTMLKLSTDASTPANPNINGYGLKVSSYFTPFNQQALSDADSDLGSGGGIVLPDQPGAHTHEFLGSGKQGVIYLVDRDSMGGFNASTDNVIQKVSLGHGTFSSPAYFNSAIYYHAVGDVLKEYTLGDASTGTNAGRLSLAPVAQGAVSYSATPSISSNGNANGIVWDLQNTVAAHQVLYAYNASTLAALYNSNQNVARDQMGAGVKFIVPTVADGHVFVGESGRVAVYGLISPPTTAPAAPSGLTAAATGPNSVQLNWVDNSDNEGGFKIERSTDNSNFSQIDIASANALSYIDTTAVPSTLYYYRIRATNVIGDSAYTTPSASATTPAVTGAVNVYHFDAGSGTTAVDSVSANNGTLIGGPPSHPLPQWVTGRIGAGALTFSGDGVALQTASESAVQTANNLATVLGSTSSFNVWFKTAQTGSNTHFQAPAITGVEQAAASNDINWGTIDASGHMGIFVGDSGLYSTSVVNDNVWHNLGITRDAVSGAVKIYIDGSLQTSGTLPTGNKTSTFNLIGALSQVANDGVTRTGDIYFNGSLDEVRIYNQVISATEMAGLAILPGAPSLTQANAVSGNLVHLVWTTPSNYTQNIEVDRKTGAGGSYAALATLGAGATTYDDPTVSPGVQYFYTITAIDLAGSSPASNAMSVTPPAPVIVGRYVFYNESGFDDNNGSSNTTDRTAIDSTKSALLPGQSATFANYTGYLKGLNGIIVDIANLTLYPRIDDINLLVGNDNNPGGWAQAPFPTFVNVYPGRGVGGSTQITLIWDDNDIQNEWLQVTLLANALDHHFLPADDVFYFGNQIGETGNSPGDTFVDASDMVAIRDNVSGSAVPPSNRFDLNKDGFADSGDMVVARDHVSDPASQLRLISAPATPAAAAPAAGASETGAIGTGLSTAVSAAAPASKASASPVVTAVSSPVKPPAPAAGGLKTAIVLAPAKAAPAQKPVVVVKPPAPQLLFSRPLLPIPIKVDSGTSLPIKATDPVLGIIHAKVASDWLK